MELNYNFKNEEEASASRPQRRMQEPGYIVAGEPLEVTVVCDSKTRFCDTPYIEISQSKKYAAAKNNGYPVIRKSTRIIAKRKISVDSSDLDKNVYIFEGNAYEKFEAETSAEIRNQEYQDFQDTISVETKVQNSKEKNAMFVYPENCNIKTKQNIHLDEGGHKVLRETTKNRSDGSNERSFSEKTTYCRPVIHVFNPEQLRNEEYVVKSKQKIQKLQCLVKQLIQVREKEQQKASWENYIKELKIKHTILNNKEPMFTPSLEPHMIPSTRSNLELLDDLYGSNASYMQTRGRSILQDLYHYNTTNPNGILYRHSINNTSKYYGNQGSTHAYEKEPYLCYPSSGAGVFRKKLSTQNKSDFGNQEALERHESSDNNVKGSLWPCNKSFSPERLDRSIQTSRITQLFRCHPTIPLSAVPIPSPGYDRAMKYGDEMSNPEKLDSIEHKINALISVMNTFMEHNNKCRCKKHLNVNSLYYDSGSTPKTHCRCTPQKKKKKCKPIPKIPQHKYDFGRYKNDDSNDNSKYSSKDKESKRTASSLKTLFKEIECACHKEEYRVVVGSEVSPTASVTSGHAESEELKQRDDIAETSSPEHGDAATQSEDTSGAQKRSRMAQHTAGASTGHSGTTQDGKTYDGQTPDDGTTTHVDKTYDGKTRENKIHNGKTHEANTYDGKSHDNKIRDGKTHNGKTRDGKINDGKTHDGKTHDGKTHDGKTFASKTHVSKKRDGTTHDGKVYDDKTQDAKNQAGKTHAGKKHEGTSNEGKTYDGRTHDSKTHDGNTSDDGQTYDGKVYDGKTSDSKIQANKKKIAKKKKQRKASKVSAGEQSKGAKKTFWKTKKYDKISGKGANRHLKQVAQSNKKTSSQSNNQPGRLSTEIKAEAVQSGAIPILAGQAFPTESGHPYGASTQVGQPGGFSTQGGQLYSHPMQNTLGQPVAFSTQGGAPGGRTGSPLGSPSGGYPGPSGGYSDGPTSGHPGSYLGENPGGYAGSHPGGYVGVHPGSHPGGYVGVHPGGYAGGHLGRFPMQVGQPHPYAMQNALSQPGVFATQVGQPGVFATQGNQTGRFLTNVDRTGDFSTQYAQPGSVSTQADPQHSQSMKNTTGPLEDISTQAGPSGGFPQQVNQPGGFSKQVGPAGSFSTQVGQPNAHSMQLAQAGQGQINGGLIQAPQGAGYSAQVDPNGKFGNQTQYLPYNMCGYVGGAHMNLGQPGQLGFIQPYYEDPSNPLAQFGYQQDPRFRAQSQQVTQNVGAREVQTPASLEGIPYWMSAKCCRDRKRIREAVEKKENDTPTGPLSWLNIRRVFCGVMTDNSTPQFDSSTANESHSSIDDILIEEMGKSDQAKRDIEEILKGELAHQPCAVQFTFDVPTSDRCTEVTDSLSETRIKEKGKNVGTEIVPFNSRQRRITMAVNTDPLGLLALLKVSTETFRRLLVNFDYYSYLPALPVSRPEILSTDKYICNICGKAFNRATELSEHIAKHRVGNKRDCCICSHVLDIRRQRMSGVFHCQFCGKCFTRAYCRQLHEQSCARRNGCVTDIPESLAILR